MERFVYYIVSASTEDNQAGIFRFSKPFKNLGFAKQAMKKVKNDFVRIEGHHEINILWKMGSEKWEKNENKEIEIID